MGTYAYRMLRTIMSDDGCTHDEKRRRCNENRDAVNAITRRRCRVDAASSWDVHSPLTVTGLYGLMYDRLTTDLSAAAAE